MRPSPLKHTLAVLRHAIGPEMTQKELARLVKRSPVTIQKIELGKLPLAESLANEISKQTGIDVGWLLENDVSKPPREWKAGRPYDKETFELYQANLNAKFGQLDYDGGATRFILSGHMKKYAKVGIEAMKGEKFRLFLYKVSRFWVEMEKEFLPHQDPTIPEEAGDGRWGESPMPTQTPKEARELRRLLGERTSAKLEEDAAAAMKQLWTSIAPKIKRASLKQQARSQPSPTARRR